jgi:hypothetical protein
MAKQFRYGVQTVTGTPKTAGRKMDTWLQSQILPGFKIFKICQDRGPINGAVVFNIFYRYEAGSTNVKAGD